MAPPRSLPRAALLALALASPLIAARAADSCTYADELTCLRAGGREDYACAWCRPDTDPAGACVTQAGANRLPDSECGNATRTDCDLQKTNETCTGLIGCNWCTSRTVKPICGNLMNTSTLPRSVFSCTGPYMPAASEAAAAYDFFLIELQWAITECQDVFKCKAAQQFFTLHGLWPENTDGSYPQNCPGAPAFDPNVLKPILPALNTFWPSLNGPSQTFWQHEYEKHGSCCMDVYPKQLDYFNGTLSLLETYNVTRALAAHGIVPSSMYPRPNPAHRPNHPPTHPSS